MSGRAAGGVASDAGFDAVLDALAERVATKVLARLAGPTEHYGTSKSAVLPPGKSRAWAVRNVRRIPGAMKVGRDWIVPVAAFDAWLTEEDLRRCGAAPAPKGAFVPDSTSHPSLAERADRTLLAAGLRRTR